MLVPLARTDVMRTPGKHMSGLLRPSAVGPSDENDAIASVSSVAPIVIASCAQPGEPTVPAPGPALPAATQTTCPWRIAASHVWERASLPSHAPSDPSARA